MLGILSGNLSVIEADIEGIVVATIIFRIDRYDVAAVILLYGL